MKESGIAPGAPPALEGGGRLPDTWDEDAAALVRAVVTMLQAVLADELVSVVVHGSLAMGCYRAPKSDVDVLAVCAGPLAAERRRDVAEGLLRAHEGRGSGAGLEFSLVTAAAAQAAAHPMPFEVHFSAEHAEQVRAGVMDYGPTWTDPDLAAHVTVARARGVAIFGLPAPEVFASMAWRHYLDAVEADIGWASEPGRLAANPAYFVLNACRLLQIEALGEGTVASKAEGAAWAITQLPAQYAPMVEAALAHYLSGEPAGRAVLDAEAVGKFAAFVRCRTG